MGIVFESTFRQKLTRNGADWVTALDNEDTKTFVRIPDWA